MLISFTSFFSSLVWHNCFFNHSLLRSLAGRSSSLRIDSFCLCSFSRKISAYTLITYCRHPCSVFLICCSSLVFRLFLAVTKDPALIEPATKLGYWIFHTITLEIFENIEKQVYRIFHSLLNPQNIDRAKLA